MTYVMPEINGVIYTAMVSGYVLDGVCSNDSSSVGCKTIVIDEAVLQF